jgi:radical SAM protein with 4Fe4S-binding SPASM domain
MATKKTWAERNQRQFLRDALPLKTPFSAIIEATNACNFNCVYCIHTTRKQVGPNNYIDVKLYEKFINDLQLFPEKLKTIHFIGVGEPLLHKEIATLIKLSKTAAREVVLITNGALLKPEKVEQLLDAGLDVIRVSLQGVSADDYINIAGVGTGFDFDMFVSNLEYLYKNKRQCRIYMKMPDIAINIEEKKLKCEKLFRDKCDNLYIQDIVPTEGVTNYDKIGETYNKQYNRTVHQEALTEVLVCPQPFFQFLLLPDGKVHPCYIAENEIEKIGNVNNENMYDIWNGDKLRSLRFKMLQGERADVKYCAKCNLLNVVNNKYDNIDDARWELLEKYKQI